jgi:colanic acid/amylovoran biosynthesis glycosyltransferase
MKTQAMLEQGDAMPGRLLMVTPPVIVASPRGLRIDPHFANNLSGYLTRVDRVTVACSVAKPGPGSGISNSLPLEGMSDRDRIDVIVLPEPYREDRYIRHRAAVARSLRREIERCEYLSFAPHAPFDWATLAAKIARQTGRGYDIEADWDMANVSWMLWSTMKWGPNKFRKYVWFKIFLRNFDRCMAHSSVALLQGADVFAAYRDIAPNPYKVLNVQVAGDDFVPPSVLVDKIKRVYAGEKMQICYAGRATDMKGPFDWLSAIRRLTEGGVQLKATWFGGGDRLERMRDFVSEHGLAAIVSLPGDVDRAEVIEAVRQSHLFLFCHLSNESPRCVVEALANGTPIIGYDSLYVRDLATGGGGEFASLGDWGNLAKIVAGLDGDRARLASLIRGAAKSAELFDRDKAIERRIGLIVDSLDAARKLLRR